MRWLGKVIGGTVGYSVGFVPGAVIGSGLGAVVDHALDKPPGSDLPEIEAEGQFADDPQGRYAQIQFSETLPGGAIAVATIETRRGKRLAATPAFHKDGAFLVRRPIQRGGARFYIPFSALKYRRKGTYVLRVTVRFSSGDNQGVTDLGQCSFEFPMPKARAWKQVDYLDSLVGLCAAVIHADGVPRESGPALVESFFIDTMRMPPDEVGQLHTLLQAAPEVSVEDLAKQTLRRLPELRPMTVLGLMAEVARSGGIATRKARTTIRDASEYLGIPAHRWPEVQSKLQLVVHDPWGVLGLHSDATTREVKKAYRTKLKGLHPDRVAGLDTEIQDLAETRTIELREAYEACLDALN